ncbi:MAG: AbrB/MazE/SpoVT family DNA-binding domain-containing protein [Oscillospiraceae bacterium]|nr:AbrB/MazE/SpoVT family DNA-binding domain-containing protein [Oscillospiraceae bacterium]
MELTRTVKVNSWGSSLAIRIPHEIVKTTGLKEKSLLEIKVDGDNFTITKSSKKEHMPFKDRIKDFKGVYTFEEIDTGFPVGNEVF